MATGDPPRRTILRVLLGRAPGLENLLVAAVPALVLGGIVAVTVGKAEGAIVWLVATVLGVLVARRFVRPPSAGPSPRERGQGDELK